MTRVLRLDELEELKRTRRRTCMATALALRNTTRRTTSRRINDAIRLARLAVLAAEAYLEVVRWGRTGEERILRLRDLQ